MGSAPEKMKFLCFPGAFGSAKNFEVQLAPFCEEMSDCATFYFTEGKIPCSPPEGFLDYFGPAPHFRFFEYDGIQQNDVLERVRDFPEGEVAEDVIRELMPPGADKRIRQNIQNALDGIYKTIEEEGPFDGICAYSEGTVAAGILVLDESRRFEKEGRPRSIKRVVFFAGWPPVDPEKDQMLLEDTSDEIIDVPSVHCVGADDPYLAGAMALFNVSDQDTAILFDHGKGHTIPRDPQTLKELGDAVRSLREHDE